MRSLRERVGSLSPEQEFDLCALLERQGVQSSRRAGERDLVRDGEDRLQLVAYVVGESHLDAEEIGRRIQQLLPDYACPSRYVQLELLPKLDNGKCDYARLPRPESVVSQTQTRPDGPQTISTQNDQNYPVTEKLIGILCDLLGTSNIQAKDNFFEIGGDSIVAIQLVSRAREAGIPLSVAAITSASNLSSLAATLKQTPAREATVSAFGPTPLTPIQSWFFSHRHPEPERWNMGGVLKLAEPVNAQTLEAAIYAFINQHPVLSSKFIQTGDSWEVEISESPAPNNVVTIEPPVSSQPDEQDAALLTRIQAEFDLSSGWLLRFAIVVSNSSDDSAIGQAGSQAVKICWAVHHLICDGLSVQILLDGIKSECQRRLKQEVTPVSESQPSSYREWAHQLQLLSIENHAERTDMVLGDMDNAERPLSFPAELDCLDTVLELHGILVSNLQQANEAYSTTTNELLLVAVASALLDVFGPVVKIDVETHGRDVLGVDFDTSGVMGWFTTYFPVHLRNINGEQMGERIIKVKESYRQSQGSAGKYLLSRYGNALAVPEICRLDDSVPNLLFNFMNVASTGTTSAEATFWTSTISSIELLRSSRNHRSHIIELNAFASRTQIDLRLRFVANAVGSDVMKKFSDGIQAQLQLVCDHCLNIEDTVYTPSDFPDIDMDQQGLDDFISGIELD